MRRLSRRAEGWAHWFAVRSWPLAARGLRVNENPASSNTLPLGWPRELRSLCPVCAEETRNAVLSGSLDKSVLCGEHPARIVARLVERDGEIRVEKDCPKHGHFEDLISIDPEFLRTIERRFPGRQPEAPWSRLRNHGSSSIKYGRGSVLTVDLTNRCNMMCEPCFMDANQVGYVHELTLSDIHKILDDALTVEPRCQLSVQFSGGEPTLSAHFLDAIRYAREKGYFCVQCASNGIAFAQDPALCFQAKAAGLRLVYLQFDGTTNQAYRGRRVSNLFSVKQVAIDNLHRAGIDVVLVATVVKEGNDDQVGAIVQFAIDNADKITVVSFQPISFTGRERHVTAEERRAQRYTLSHLVHDVQEQLGATEPLRDWFPLAAMNPLSDLADALQDSTASLAALHCGCHPHCGVGTVLLVHKETKEMVPLADVLDLERLLADLRSIVARRTPRFVTLGLLVWSLLRNFRVEQAPRSYRTFELARQMLSQIGVRGGRVGASEGDSSEFPWRLLFVAGMWFQDGYNFDFARTEMCIIPYGTEEGEISFCAYNSGVGFRQVVESQHRTATTAEWYRIHGRHPVYAAGAEVPLPRTGDPDDNGKDAPTPGQRRRLRLVS